MRVLTQARDLARRKAREREGLFVAEGIRGVEELIRSPLEVSGVLCAPQLLDNPRGVRLRAEIDRLEVTVSDVTEREFASAASTESPQGVLAIAQIPVRTLDTLAGRDTLRVLVLDAVQDPGNVGTLLRTAHALGIDATVALPGTVDVWNAKVVRSAMGSLFHHLALGASLEILTAFLSRTGATFWGADAAGTPVATLAKPPRLALAVGNEGAGLTAPVRDAVAQLVSLPMPGDAESLNVAVATGILLYQLQP
jgi:TrmH family RNA methyltransferase